MPKTCAYAKIVGKPLAIGVCPPCSESITHVSRHYWRGEARRVLGPHMYLCSTHASIPSVRVEPMRAKAKP